MAERVTFKQYKKIAIRTAEELGYLSEYNFPAGKFPDVKSKIENAKTEWEVDDVLTKARHIML